MSVVPTPESLVPSLVVSGFNQMNQVAANQYNMEQQQFYNERNMRLQHQYNLQYMGIADALNSPKHQMERLREAGLSPSLMLKENPNHAVSQPSSPSSSNPSSVPPSSLLEGSMMAEQLKGLALDNKSKQVDLDYQPRFKAAELDKLTKEANKLASEKSYTDIQVDIMNATKEFVVAKSAAELDEILNRVDEIAQRTKGLEYDNALKLFRKEFRELTGVDFEQDNMWAAAYQLLHNGQLKPIISDLVSIAKDLILSGYDVLKEGVSSHAGEILKINAATNPAANIANMLLTLFQLLSN